MSGIERRLVERVGGYLLYGYKTELAAQPGDERRSLILLLLWVAVHLHRTCIERRVGAALDAWTTVPSTKGRSPHPLLAITRRAGLGTGELTSTPTPWQPSELRTTSAKRFSLGPRLPHRPARPDRGRHLDEWWPRPIAGADGTSRRCRNGDDRRACALVHPEWPATAAYLSSHPRRDFNPRICPVTGGACP